MVWIDTLSGWRGTNLDATMLEILGFIVLIGIAQSFLVAGAFFLFFELKFSGRVNPISIVFVILGGSATYLAVASSPFILTVRP